MRKPTLEDVYFLEWQKRSSNSSIRSCLAIWSFLATLKPKFEDPQSELIDWQVECAALRDSGRCNRSPSKTAVALQHEETFACGESNAADAAFFNGLKPKECSYDEG